MPAAWEMTGAAPVPSMARSDYHPLYLKGIAEFNRRRYFESHEVWESLWVAERGPLRGFYKALIQAAVALHHLGNGNLHGAWTLLCRAQSGLADYRPKCLGLDVEGFLQALVECFEGLPPAGGPTKQIAPPPIRAPQIHLEP